VVFAEGQPFEVEKDDGPVHAREGIGLGLPCIE
jgi:hypothetical protein